MNSRGSLHRGLIFMMEPVCARLLSLHGSQNWICSDRTRQDALNHPQMTAGEEAGVQRISKKTFIFKSKLKAGTLKIKNNIFNEAISGQYR